MVTIAESAKDYESKATKNISELEKVSTNLELKNDSFDFTDNDNNTKTVTQKIVEINDEKYRVPVTVIQQLKVMLEDNPNLQNFKVKKTGAGKDNTRYTVIPLMG